MYIKLTPYVRISSMVNNYMLIHTKWERSGHVCSHFTTAESSRVIIPTTSNQEKCEKKKTKNLGINSLHAIRHMKNAVTGGIITLNEIIY